MMSNPSSEEQEALKKTAGEPRSQCTENGQGPRQEGGTQPRGTGMAAVGGAQVNHTAKGRVLCRNMRAPGSSSLGSGLPPLGYDVWDAHDHLNDALTRCYSFPLLAIDTLPLSPLTRLLLIFCSKKSLQFPHKTTVA